MPLSSAAPREAVRRRSFALVPIALGTILLVAAGLRLWGIDDGLPFPYQPDEPFLISVASRMLATGDLNPRFWDYPSLQMYSLLVLMALRQALAPSLPALAAPGVEYLLGRLLNVVYALGTIYLVYVVGRRLFDRWSGVVAAALLGTSYLHNLMSHMLKVDVPATFYATAVLAAATVLVRRPTAGWYAASGALVGLAMAAKYPVAAVTIVVPIAHAIAWQRNSLRQLPRLVLAGGSAVVVFAAACPYIFLDAANFLSSFDQDIVAWAATGHEGQEGHVLASYLGWLFLDRDAPTAWLAVLGIGFGLARRRRAALLLAAFPLLYFIEIAGLWEIRFQAYLLPLYPFLAVLGGFATIEAGRRLGRSGATAASILLALGIGSQFLQSADHSALLASQDVRTTALHWIERNVSPGSRIVREGYTPFVPEDRYRVTELWRAIDRDPAWYREEKVEYLVLGRFMYGRFFAEPERYATQVAKYRQLLESATLVERLTGPMQGTRAGEVDVYRLSW